MIELMVDRNRLQLKLCYILYIRIKYKHIYKLYIGLCKVVKCVITFVFTSFGSEILTN